MPDSTPFHFLRPAWLWLLVPAGLIVWSILRGRDPHRAWRGIVPPHLLAALMVPGQAGRRLRPVHLLAVVLFVGALAMAGPAWRQEPSPFSEDKAALVIALEVTPSMLVSDLQPSRLERSVLKIREILKHRSGDRTCLIAYAGSAHLVMPLTRDAGVIESFAGELHPRIMPREGDNPAAALALAGSQLAGTNQNGSILFICDGMTGEEAKRSARERTSGASPILILGAVGMNPESPERRELSDAAKVLGAPLEFITPDGRDVATVVSRIERQLSAAAEADGGERWRDEGWWLTPVLCALALFWFRPGWVVQHGTSSA